jgi:hypothetical protein
MAFGHNVRWLMIESPVGCRVMNRLQVDEHGLGFLFSLTMLKRKALVELVAMLYDFKNQVHGFRD